MRRLSILLLLALTACHGSPTEPESPRARLAGTVVFIESGAPVVGARITATMPMFAGTPEAQRPETMTDSQGHYSMTVNAGQHSVQVFAPGATSPARIEMVDVLPNAITTANFQISANGCVVIDGHIRDGVTHGTVSGATVSFFGQTTVSDGDGYYRLMLGCPPHPATTSATMIVDHPNYQRREFLMGVPTYSRTSDIWIMPK